MGVPTPIFGSKPVCRFLCAGPSAATCVYFQLVRYKRKLMSKTQIQVKKNRLVLFRHCILCHFFFYLIQTPDSSEKPLPFSMYLFFFFLFCLQNFMFSFRSPPPCLSDFGVQIVHRDILFRSRAHHVTHINRGRWLREIGIFFLIFVNNWHL